MKVFPATLCPGTCGIHMWCAVLGPGACWVFALRGVLCLSECSVNVWSAALIPGASGVNASSTVIRAGSSERCGNVVCCCYCKY